MPRLKRIHVYRHIIAANKKNDRTDPALSIVEGGKTTHAYPVEIDGPSAQIYSPEKPLSCGATVWIETRSEVEYA